MKHPQSCKLSLQWRLWYWINVFVQMIKIFFNWLMRLVDWFHWHFCTVVRVRALTSLLTRLVWVEFWNISLLFQHDFNLNLAFMFISNHLICWLGLKNYAKRSFSRLKMLVIHVCYTIFRYHAQITQFPRVHAGLSGACSDKFPSCSEPHDSSNRGSRTLATRLRSVH